MIKWSKISDQIMKATSMVRDIVKKTMKNNVKQKMPAKGSKKVVRAKSGTKSGKGLKQKSRLNARFKPKQPKKLKPRVTHHHYRKSKLEKSRKFVSKVSAHVPKKKLKAKSLLAQKKPSIKKKKTVKEVRAHKIKEVRELSTMLGIGTKNEKKVDLNWIINLLKDARLRGKLVEISGEETIEVIKALTKYSMDDEISKNFSIKISDVRSVLNKLHTFGIVKYIKTKDAKTSWFVYNWYIDLDNLQQLSLSLKNESTSVLESKNPYDYYFCPACMTDEFTVDESYQMNFHCPICSSLLQPVAEKNKNTKPTSKNDSYELLKPSKQS